MALLVGQGRGHDLKGLADVMRTPKSTSPGVAQSRDRDLERLADLIRTRNSNEVSIAKEIGRARDARTHRRAHRLLHI